ncbi:MAG: pseudaminic acid cytidylyltransferase [Proteobacteria bacterium]|nr:pseudaminic acid cytidylyltransferase [Pseudomonadota bacterium]
MNIAVIPARAGSKRIPGKNIRPFCGKPMIAWSIEAARNAGIFDRVIVSTDSEEIAAVARHHGAETPFLRPAKLSGDHIATAPVLEHALAWLNGQGQTPERLCCIYATAAFVRPEHLRQGLETLMSTGCSSCFSATSYAFSIFRSLKLEQDGTLSMFWPEHEMTRSQDLPEAYHDAGQFYWLDCREFQQSGKIYAADARPVLLPRHIVQDIDTPEDWIRAEYMFQAVRNAEGIS